MSACAAAAVHAAPSPPWTLPPSPRPARSLLGIRTTSGQRVQLRAQGPAAAAADALTTGMPIKVAGRWMHPQATPGKPREPPFFLFVDVNSTGSPAGAAPPPALTSLLGGIAGAAGGVVSGVSKLLGPLAPLLSFNQLVSQDVKAIVIPSERQPPKAAACSTSAWLTPWWLHVSPSSCLPSHTNTPPLRARPPPPSCRRGQPRCRLPRHLAAAHDGVPSPEGSI